MSSDDTRTGDPFLRRLWRFLGFVSDLPKPLPAGQPKAKQAHEPGPAQEPAPEQHGDMPQQAHPPQQGGQGGGALTFAGAGDALTRVPLAALITSLAQAGWWRPDARRHEQAPPLPGGAGGVGQDPGQAVPGKGGKKAGG